MSVTAHCGVDLDAIMADDGDELRAKLQATKVAVGRARIDAAQHVQNASRQMDYRTFALHEKAISSLRQRVEARRFENAFDGWAEITADARRLDHLLWQG